MDTTTRFLLMASLQSITRGAGGGDQAQRRALCARGSNVRGGAWPVKGEAGCGASSQLLDTGKQCTENTRQQPVTPTSPPRSSHCLTAACSHLHQFPTDIRLLAACCRGLASRLQIPSLLDRTYSAQRFFIFFFNFGSCGRLSWLNCQFSSAR